MASGNLSLNYAEFRQKAKDVTGIRNKFTELLNEVDRKMNDIDTVWKDKAAQEFTNGVRNTRDKFDAFGKALEDLVTHMNTVAQKYEDLSGSISSAQKF